jgi:hypothetical protein
MKLMPRMSIYANGKEKRSFTGMEVINKLVAIFNGENMMAAEENYWNIFSNNNH